MGWEWMPETPEEIAEHQRMRKNLIECQQMYDGDSVNKKPKRSHSIIVAALVAFALIYFCFIKKYI